MVVNILDKRNFLWFLAILLSVYPSLKKNYYRFVSLLLYHLTGSWGIWRNPYCSWKCGTRGFFYI